LLLFLTDDATQVLFSSQICRNSRVGIMIPQQPPYFRLAAQFREFFDGSAVG
jgi:hypothetical protein